VAGLGDSAVDDGARLRVGGAFGFTIGCRVEAGVALSNNDDGHAGQAFLCIRGWVDVLAGFLQEGQLLLNDHVVLAL
jgi:hypothetical protein